MGVMCCQVNGCDSTLCYISHYEHGYICKDCYNRLVESCPQSDADVERFFDTPRTSSYDSNGYDLESKFYFSGD